MAHPLLDVLPDGVVVADADQRVEAISAVAASMLGVDADAAIGAPLADVLRLQDQDGQDWLTHNCPYGGLTTRSGLTEQAWLLPNGTEVLVTARMHRSRRGGPVERVALVIRSGRGRARLDRERSDLVATVAHELRSPLTGVKGFVQVMLNRWDRLSDEQKKLMLTTVSVDSDRLSRLIAELLDVARIDTGRLQLHRRPTDAGALATRVVESVRAGTPRTIELDVAESLPAVGADPDKLVQVVTNLVENAVRHGEGVVRVTLAPLEADAALERGGVRLVVEDDGEGIAPALRRTVFTKFWKTGERGGSGLGLYVVNGLVRAHGGRVRIEDAASGGARMVVDWPAAEPL
ncbi:PAS domain-containing protein [Nocardioides sp. TRM66260-LWL]|uniref:sensor histidine kinase n=1 Tax=Nocardioides sp. TRM66260-LWL TaxID=2874478 RepID=UPI001CC6C0FD|nr:ATP-binding protein [Nocardioides sp. TRM66260-LWL]MBZ5733883.1 PAS domain-containing protein [Nocardioides sp. TRM66260-LWL]